MRALTLIPLAAIIAIAGVSPAFADNSIVVESRTFTPGQTACTVGVFVSNAVPITGMLFQLETRSVSGGAYFAGPVGPTFFRVRSGGRVDNSPLGTADPGGSWPGAATTSRRLSSPAANNTCSGPVSHSWSVATLTVDGISPDAIEYATVSQGEPGVDEFYALAAGSDPEGRDNASFFFLFNANGSPGCFEIDSCCTTPANHIGYIAVDTSLIVPDFTKGVVCIEGAPVNLPPVVTCPANIEEQVPSGSTGATINYSVTVVDEDPLLTANCIPPSGSFFPIGTTLVTCIATDTAGLADTCAFEITIIESPNQRPVVHCPPLVSATVNEGEVGAVITFAIDVSDDGPPLQAASNPPSGSFFEIGQTLVECVAQDAQGLADTCYFYAYVSEQQESRVVVESRNVLPGQTACTVGVFISNAVPITGMLFQLETRSVSGGAYFVGPVGPSFFRVRSGGRVDNSPLGTADPGGSWPGAAITSRRLSSPAANNACSGPVSHSWSVATLTVDGISPDAIEYATVSQGEPGVDQFSALAAGSDPDGRDNASFFFLFDADLSEGCFEIDSCCTTPANHIGYIDVNSSLIVPSFTKGTICITDCACACNGNPSVPINPDVNVLDVVYTANVAFRNSPSIPDTDPLCPVGATDVDCDSFTTIIDVVKVIEVAFRNGNPATVYCDPCP